MILIVSGPSMFKLTVGVCPENNSGTNNWVRLSGFKPVNHVLRTAPSPKENGVELIN